MSLILFTRFALVLEIVFVFLEEVAHWSFLPLGGTAFNQLALLVIAAVVLHEFYEMILDLLKQLTYKEKSD